MNIIQGDSLDFVDSPPIRHHAFSNFTEVEYLAAQAEVKKLLSKKVIVQCDHEKCEFVSSIFLVPKPDGGYRLILNLKDLNVFVKFEHFKMDGIKDVLTLVTKNCFMAKIDLKDAYYSVPVSPDFQKYLKFEFDGQLYKFVCFPNGLGPCPRKFTKIGKVPLSVLRTDGVSVSGYIDDFFTKAGDFDSCVQSVEKMVSMFMTLGFVIHPEKSQLVPSQRLEFLGFVIDSTTMTISLNDRKRKNLKKLVNQALSIKCPSIRFIAKVIGTLVSVFPASKYGPLHYRNLDNDKTVALQHSFGKFDSPMTLSVNSKHELLWWRNNIDSVFNHIATPPIKFKMHCDASNTGWGVKFLFFNTGGVCLLRSRFFI